jgi:hypothetical protein
MCLPRPCFANTGWHEYDSLAFIIIIIISESIKWFMLIYDEKFKPFSIALSHFQVGNGERILL